MRYMLMLTLAALLVTGCRSNTNSLTISEFQRHLNQAHANDHGVVKAVSLVQTTKTNYEGEATVAAYNSTFTVPLTVTSDGRTVLVATDDLKLTFEFMAAFQRDVAALKGKYSDYILSPAMFEFMPTELKAARADFTARLSVVGPIVETNDYYFGSGCMAHECGDNAAAWTVDKTTGEGVAIVEIDNPAIPGGMEAHKTFELYGATDEIPKPLYYWATQDGMTEGNVATIGPAYRSPAGGSQ